MVALAVIAIVLVRSIIADSESYLEADDFSIGFTIGHTPTPETSGLTLQFDRIEGGVEACRGIEVKSHGMYVDLRLVRASAPESVHADFPMTPLEGKLVGQVDFEHDRRALDRATPIEYRIYGGSGEIYQKVTVTPVL